MERFFKDLKEHAMKIIDYQKKKKRKMIPLTDKENNSYEKQKFCYIYKKEFRTDKNHTNVFKLYQKSEIIVITLENLEELLIVFTI